MAFISNLLHFYKNRISRHFFIFHKLIVWHCRILHMNGETYMQGIPLYCNGNQGEGGLNLSEQAGAKLDKPQAGSYNN